MHPVDASDLPSQLLSDHAAQQMLKYHIMHNTNAPNPVYQGLQDEFERLGKLLSNTGYPNNCDKIAIINGDPFGRSTTDAGRNRGLAGRAGELFLNADVPIPAVPLVSTGTSQVEVDGWFSPSSTATRSARVYRGNIRMTIAAFVSIPLFNRVEYANPRADYDIAAGGFIRNDAEMGVENGNGDFGDIFVDILGLYHGSVFNIQYQPDHFTFVPMVSAADVTLDDIGSNHDDNFYLRYNLFGDANYSAILDPITYNVINPTRSPFDRIYPTADARVFPSLIDRREDLQNISHGFTSGIRSTPYSDYFSRITLPTVIGATITTHTARTRANCDRLYVDANLVSSLGCPFNTKYSWYKDNQFVTETIFPILRMYEDDNQQGTSHTLRVEIQKRERNFQSWQSVGTFSSTYIVGTIIPPADCNFPNGKVRVEDLETKTSEILLYPNPAQDKVNVVFPTTTTGTIQLLTLQGKILIEDSLIEKSKCNLSLSNLSAGVYLVRVITSEGTSTQKLIIY